MKYYRRYIVFTKRPLKEAFRYKDVFILQPITREGIPFCPYAKHYPSFLDYWVTEDEGKSDIDLIPHDINKVKEICAILTSLSNFEVFSYDTSMRAWGIVAPIKTFEEMTEDEAESANENAKESVWIPFTGFMYKEYSQDRIITNLSILNNTTEMVLDKDPFYFTNHPIEEDKEQVIFQDKIIIALDTYYGLPEEAQKSVYSAMVLIANGIKLGIQHQSLGFISYISSIETMVELENKGQKIQRCETCGQPVYSVRKKFLSYLEKYVSRTKSSKKKFSDLYTLRSKIAHSGKLFLSDVEFSLLNQEETNKEWLKYMEVQQLARLSLFRWLLLNRISSDTSNI